MNEEELVQLDSERSRTDCSYVRAADGAFYLEVPKPGGGFEYVPAERGLQFEERDDGKWTVIRDKNEYNRQRSMLSHSDYFEKNPKEAKQGMKRLDAYESALRQLTIDRVQPGISPNVKTITDNEFERFMAMYKDAVAHGEANKCEFQPMTAYAHKLVTKSGKIIRPILAGEVGMINSMILVLEAGYGTGNRVQVK